MERRNLVLAKMADLQGAVVVTSAHDAEVQAVVGDRKPRHKGFDRALDALRPVGSLIKPIVYLTALQDPTDRKSHFTPPGMPSRVHPSAGSLEKSRCI